MKKIVNLWSCGLLPHNFSSRNKTNKQNKLLTLAISCEKRRCLIRSKKEKKQNKNNNNNNNSNNDNDNINRNPRDQEILGWCPAGDSLISWGEGSSSALVSNPSRDGVSIKILVWRHLKLNPQLLWMNYV